MKKLFIGLLIVAAGTAIFFYGQKQKNSVASERVAKENIVGAWHLDSLHSTKDSGTLTGILPFIDSILTDMRCEFTNDGKTLVTLHDSKDVDTAQYRWSADQKLIVGKPDEVTPDSLTVITLIKDSLVVHDKDSTIFYFTKVK